MLTIDPPRLLIHQPTTPGEQQTDGLTPNYSQGIQVSPTRWLLLYDTVHRLGWDIWHSIYYQLRDGAPDGPLITEKRLLTLQPIGKDTAGNPIVLSQGMPIIFGTPTGTPVPHANLFLITYTRIPARIHNGGLITRLKPADQDYADYRHHLGTWHLQAQLNDTQDGLTILQPPAPLNPPHTTTPYPWHGWTQPLPDPHQPGSWLDAITVIGGAGDTAVIGENRTAIMRYTYDPAAHRIRWTHTYPTWDQPPGDQTGEHSLVLLPDGTRILATRCFRHGGNTAWYHLDDHYTPTAPPTYSTDTYGQRYAFADAAGHLRIFTNRQDITPYVDRRNPLYTYRVDPTDFTYHDQQTILDTRAKDLPIETPFVDHVHLHAPHQNTQLLTIRVIDRHQVARADQNIKPIPPETQKITGIYATHLHHPA